jgi:aminoglycoside 6-adenylyltransferase
MMRTATQMMTIIKAVAESDPRVRAVYMNGSRANPNSHPDLFRDFDIVYVTTDIAGMLAERSWLAPLGTPLVHQEPDALDMAVGQTCNPETDGYTIMNVFTDGNRVDLHLETVAACKRGYGSDSQTVPLLDKDGILPPLPATSDRDHWVKRPSAELFYHHTNDFWWVAPYVAKGLWRNELLYANGMLASVIRPHLLDMCDWLVASDYDWRISTGKMHKELQQLLPETLWRQLASTYKTGTISDTWHALDASMDLFAQVAGQVASRLEFNYVREEERGSRKYIDAIRKLAPDATSIEV